MQTEGLNFSGTEYGDFKRKWIQRSLFSLLMLALLGTTMRYKIAFSMPWLPQKNVLNAHSHFAFAGWLTQVLMSLMVFYLLRQSDRVNLRKYNVLLWANLITAWGMLITFPWNGYGLYSIVCSTLSIFVSYFFAVIYWRDLNLLPQASVSHQWFKAALLWSVLSSLGAFALAYMMAAGIHHEHWYLGAIYYFLHFQYNGWFFFACAGLLYSYNQTKTSSSQRAFYLITVACLPAYLLSILWAHLPTGVFFLAALAAFMQLAGWIILLKDAFRNRIELLKELRPTVRVLLYFAVVAGTVKFLLQAGSIHPELATLAFGFRPIVIGYLHLVLLGLLTIFIIAFLKHQGLIPAGGLRKKGLIIFVAGIVLQELLLMIQGVFSIIYLSIPFINEMLFLSAVTMLGGIIILNLGIRKANSNVPA